MEPIDVKYNSYTDYVDYDYSYVDFNKKDPRFQVVDHVRISKHKTIFATEYTSNWSEEVFVISKIENTVP